MSILSSSIHITKRFLDFLLKTSGLGAEATEEKGNPEYIEKIINDIGLNINVKDEDLDRIPKDGPFVTISNHPFGGIDGIILLHLLLRRRPDFKILATPILWKIYPLSEYFIRFDSSQRRSEVKPSISGMRQVVAHIGKDKALGFFPAGEVASYDADTKMVADRRWKSAYLKLLKSLEIPIIPIYFQGKNSNLFHMVSSIHPILGSAGEFFGKKKEIRVRIGSPINASETAGIDDLDKYGRYLRAKTYALESEIEVKKFFKTALKREKEPAKIIDAVPTETIKEELNRIKEYELFTSEKYTVYCAPTLLIPYIHREIGRVREITFRAVGEGTNRSIDIDEFDLYYNQLFIWDNEEEQLVGAYRVGKGKEIIAQFGVKGFYTRSLFKIHKDFTPILKESIELGRSFITEPYQRKPMSLFLLWKGILYFLLKHPEYRYLIGPVSISNQFSKFSKDLIIKFLKQNHFNHELGRLITPRKKFKVQSRYDTDIVLENTRNDINKVDRFISDIEPTNYRMPVLLKKYLKQNAKIIGFNIDPKFNNALDGLVILDLYEVPFNMIESLSKEVNDDSILERFKMTEDEKREEEEVKNTNRAEHQKQK
ncbi:MAG TPA: GNAT family N-acyltransferase [Salinivirga sp.]|uniref:lysophospholipid acyltransferase family protein n=1 Tax=Salinivirga sp. TaxID=1970192 RepID=UPI002B48DCD1|nr:GNAT family N-acyltransferase [Salinivirga sp.]HKK59536.1 GNAT family N-acyltransferase [Salinivirga sp.]